MHIEWIEDARADLRHLIEYISYDSEFYAKQFAEKIVDKVENISLQPKVGRIVPEIGNDEIREVFIKSYRIIYRQLPKGIQVLAIIHGYKQLDTSSDKWG